MAERRLPEVTELVYVPQPTWLPFFVAVGLAGVLIGLFAGWVWSAIGAVVFLVAFGRWIRRIGAEVSRMPREQRPATAVLPAIPPRRD
jgi:bacteriorhodopsin